jgi:hypothetical protein
MLARENTSKCCLSKLVLPETQMAPILATAKPCQMAGDKGKVGSAVGLLQLPSAAYGGFCWVGIEMSGDPGLEHLALS